MTHGGYRQPTNPAPVSGAGADSRRTDGGPGSKTQPIRAPSGGPYGQRQALVNAQRAFPLPDTTQLPSASPGAGRPPAPPPIPGARPDPFGPTRRPGEPGTAGIEPGNQLDAITLLEMLNQVRPSPFITQMILRARGRV